MCKVQAPVAPGGRYSKDAFRIDLGQQTVTCPAGQVAAMRPAGANGGRTVRFGEICAGCPLAERCTASKTGRTIYIGPYEQQLARARARQADPAWKDDYTQTRPKVERKNRPPHAPQARRPPRPRARPRQGVGLALDRQANTCSRTRVGGGGAVAKP